MRDEVKIGYWRLVGDRDTKDLPDAIGNTQQWKGQVEFIFALALLQQENKSTTVAYRGMSHCRICQKLNGNKEYELNYGKNYTVCWPEGFMHYVQDHNVQPPVQDVILVLALAESNKVVDPSEP